MRILFIGDVIGHPGRKILRDRLTSLKESRNIDFTIANAENLAHGFGVTPKVFNDLINCGVDFCTSGNHIWDRKEVLPLLEEETRIIRPANYPEGTPGRGYMVYETENALKIGILNLSGRTFMDPVDNPFIVADDYIEEIKRETPIIFVDFHAEATSEKIAFGWHLDGRVSALVGTHTHVQTADERILPGGTAYITDVGMTGGHDSVIGAQKEAILARFRTLLPHKFSPADKDTRCSFVVVDIDDSTGKAVSIERGQVSGED